MNSSPYVLGSGVAQHLHLPSIGIYFYIDNVSGQGRDRPFGVQGHAQHYWAAGVIQFSRQLFERN